MRDVALNSGRTLMRSHPVSLATSVANDLLSVLLYTTLTLS